MQTDLILCLMPTGEIESRINYWRQTNFPNYPLLGALPPFIPLAFPKKIPTFAQLRNLAHHEWPVCQFSPFVKFFEQPGGSGLLLPLEQPNWDIYQAQILMSLGEQETETDFQPFSIPIGPWFFLGHLTKGISEFPPSEAIPPILAKMNFRAPFLCLLRIGTQSDSMADLIFWELLARHRVKKQFIRSDISPI